MLLTLSENMNRFSNIHHKLTKSIGARSSLQLQASFRYRRQTTYGHHTVANKSLDTQHTRVCATADRLQQRLLVLKQRLISSWSSDVPFASEPAPWEALCCDLCHSLVGAFHRKAEKTGNFAIRMQAATWRVGIAVLAAVCAWSLLQVRCLICRTEFMVKLPSNDISCFV